MKYSQLCEVYEALGSTTKRLEKIDILADFLKKLYKEKSSDDKWIYLLRGRVLPDYDGREFGISTQLIMKVISKSSGVSLEEVGKKFNEIGDLGEVAQKLMSNKKQSTLSFKSLDVGKVFDNLNKIFSLEGKGSVDRKIALVSELLGNAKGNEAKYIIRTVLNDLRVGVADSTLREGIAAAFFGEDRKEISEKLESAYELNNDFAELFEAAAKGKKALDKITLVPGKPMSVMLPVKVTDINEGFRICGEKVALEHKYDGFRMVISFDGKEVKLFTRRLEDVTMQFPDVSEVVKSHVKAKSFIIDCEVVGYDSKTKKYRPFEYISQRIKRKYHVDKLIKELPVEINVFDVMYYNGESIMQKPFYERRKILEKIIKRENFKIRPSEQIITDSVKKAEEFYKNALKIGEEGIMFKKIDAPYHHGRRVGYIVKMKPEKKDLDLVITAAEHGTGKRAGWLTSYIISCKHGDDFVEVGKVSSGLKEKEEEGTSYQEMTNLLKPLIIREEGRRVSVKPKLVVSVNYQNIQKSPTYASGFALRFPKITSYRPDRHTRDIASLEDIKKLY